MSDPRVFINPLERDTQHEADVRAYALDLVKGLAGAWDAPPQEIIVRAFELAENALHFARQRADILEQAFARVPTPAEIERVRAGARLVVKCRKGCIGVDMIMPANAVDGPPPSPVVRSAVPQ